MEVDPVNVPTQVAEGQKPPQLPPVVQKTRRTHTKSRGGCKECKRRKLKCNVSTLRAQSPEPSLEPLKWVSGSFVSPDLVSPMAIFTSDIEDTDYFQEDKPVCAGCRKREIPCEYPNPGSSRPSPFEDRSQTQNPSRHPAIPNLMTTPDADSPMSVSETHPFQTSQKGIGSFDMEDMALWHHFIKTTASTLSNPWGDELPTLALNCDYLLHGILAVSALHIAYLHPDKKDKYNHLASHHQDLAFPALNKATTNITPENANNVFAASTLVMVSNFASFRSSAELVFPLTQTSTNEGASNWIICLRGCSSIAWTAQAHIEAGPLGFLLTQGRALETALQSGARPSAEDEESLKQISEIVLNLPSTKIETSTDEMETYKDAVERLRNMLAASAQNLSSIMQRAITSIWPATVSNTFIRLLSEKRPPALIIMAHYCLLLANINGCWYLEHRGLHLFQSVERELGNEWIAYIEHPRRVITGRS